MSPERGLTRALTREREREREKEREREMFYLTTGVTKAVVCVILSVDGAYKKNPCC